MPIISAISDSLNWIPHSTNKSFLDIPESRLPHKARIKSDIYKKELFRKKILANLELEIKDSSELERTVNDINQSNQSHGYNLRSKPVSVAVPKSGTQRRGKFIYSKGCNSFNDLLFLLTYLLTYLLNFLTFLSE